jgi:hypothetical protein
MGENWMAMLESIISDSPRIDINEMVDKYLQYEREPTEEEIHAERSERFIEGNHIVCPFEGYEEEAIGGNDFSDEEEDGGDYLSIDADDTYTRWS